MMTGGDNLEAIAGSRDELVAALIAGAPPEGWAIAEYAGSGGWSGLACLVAQGSPFLERARDVSAGTWRVRWGVVLVAGRFDTAASGAALDLMAAYALAALYAMPGWDTPAIGGARLLEVQGGRYLTATVSASRVVMLC